MKLSRELTSVTPVSKILALLLFISLPIIAFVLGRNYENLSNRINLQKGCTLEAKLCPDGSTVGRSGPNCEFAPCPNSPTPADETQFNGIITNIKYDCHFDGICSVSLDNGLEIIVGKGEGPNPEEKGQSNGIELDENQKSEFIGKEITGFAKILNDNTYTIYGNGGYFIKIADNFCGGIAGIACPDGFECQLDGKYPDAGGTCVKIDLGYKCPSPPYLNCPTETIQTPDGTNMIALECTAEYQTWAKANCPGYTGPRN